MVYRKIFLPLLFLALISSLAAAPPKPVVIKLATLAPVGSPWYDLLMDVAHEWEEISEGKVTVKMYPGGVAGDESDLVVKMRLNHLNAAAITAAGLSEIDNGVWAFSMPLMIQEFNQLDWLRSKIQDELGHRMEEAGFKVLAWADVGWAYWFSKEPIHTPEDLKKRRIFTWSDGPNIEGIWKSGGFHSVSLSAPDILPGLQTGLIDAMSTSPMTAATFQWFAIAKYMTPVRWGAMTGAILITKQAWDQIPEDIQPKLLDAAKKQEKRMMDEIRYLGDEAIRVMKSYGLEIVEITPEQYQHWLDWIEPTLPLLRGVLVDEEMFDWVMELRKDMPPPQPPSDTTQ